MTKVYKTIQTKDGGSYIVDAYASHSFWGWFFILILQLAPVFFVTGAECTILNNLDFSFEVTAWLKAIMGILNLIVFVFARAAYDVIVGEKFGGFMFYLNMILCAGAWNIATRVAASSYNITETTTPIAWAVTVLVVSFVSFILLTIPLGLAKSYDDKKKEAQKDEVRKLEDEREHKKLVAALSEVMSKEKKDDAAFLSFEDEDNEDEDNEDEDEDEDEDETSR